jgi:KamA family protein
VGIDRDEIVADCHDVAEYVKAHPEVSNVLLTGGDSFMLPTERIVEWLDLLTDLDQLDFIRFGTRTPVTFPDRILTDPELIKALARYGKKKQLYVITHFNHPAEFTDQSREAIRTLQKAGLVIKNQTVLMKGVNDDPHVLARVLKEISGLGIVPHYIFQCRPVTGVKSRFQVSLKDGAEIVSKANSLQNGLGKAADYTMSHPTGKIRILGALEDGKLLFQYKQAKDPGMIGRIFAREVGDDSWLPDESPFEKYKCTIQCLY